MDKSVGDARTQVTGLIVAYNAEDTIVRALQSAKTQVHKLIVVDDGSTDATVELVRAHAPKAEIICHEENLGIGAARESAIKACRTPFACWLDADDRWLNGRVEQLFQVLDAGADYVFDEAELHGGSGGKISELSFPDFLFQSDGLWFQLARNYIPTLGVAACRVSVAQKVGFDLEQKQAEDYDHFIRAFFMGADIRLLKGYTGIIIFCRKGSASKALTLQSEFIARALRRFDQEHILRKLYSTSLTEFNKFFVWSMFLSRSGSWTRLHDYLVSYSYTAFNSQQKSDYFFILGVCLYKLSDFHEAERSFRCALLNEATPESTNNLGVALLAQGLDGRECFQNALALKPDYLDATLNLQSGGLSLTESPLRREMYRGGYIDA